MNRIVRMAVALLVAAGLLGACTAEGKVDTSGDGVRIEADIDTTAP